MGDLGFGVLRGMGVTLKHMVGSAVDHLRGSPAWKRENGTVVQDASKRGVFTVQYPEERLKVHENFRFLPVLLVDDDTNKIRCTSCGICAKVCPPQCIWIVRTTGPDGKPVPEPEEFVVDSSICMNCGFCAEYCPFDAIKMDHRYELATVDERQSWLHKKSTGTLLVPTSYYARTHPRAWEEEEAERMEKEAKEAAKATAAAARPASPARAAGDGAPARPAARAKDAAETKTASDAVVEAAEQKPGSPAQTAGKPARPAPSRANAEETPAVNAATNPPADADKSVAAAELGADPRADGEAARSDVARAAQEAKTPLPLDDVSPTTDEVPSRVDVPKVESSSATPEQLDKSDDNHSKQDKSE
jgi:NADH-quinone oxidoreductase subunit I